MKTEITINYDSKTITIEDDKDPLIEIHFRKQTCGGKTIFKNGAYLYLGLFEILMNELYPYKNGQTVSFDSFPSREKLSKFVSDLRCVLPDYLKIYGTSTLKFGPEVNKRQINISVIATKKESIYDRSAFGERLNSINWELKNQSIILPDSATFSHTEKTDLESGSDTRWNDNALKKAFLDYRRESFDEKLLTPISPYGVNLYDYIVRTFVPQSNHKVCIIEGEGGAGKTTSIKYSSEKLITDGHKVVIVYANQLQIAEQSICSYIADRYVLFSEKKIRRRETILDLIREASHKKKVFIFIDGVDELPSKYYRELIGDDIAALTSSVTVNLYFIISTRSRAAFIEACELEGRSITAFAGRVDLNSLELGESYKELLINYPQFRTPLFISMIRNIVNLSNSENESSVFDYGNSKAGRIINKTQLFDVWMELRTSHSAELGVKPYYYTHLLTLTAYESLKRYIRNGDRSIPRSFFDIENISQLLEKLGGGTRNRIDLGFSTDRLIKVFLSTGLLVTSDNKTYMFSNLEYLLYLAGFFVSLMFVSETKERRLSRIEFLTGISIEKINPNLALVSYPEFAFNRIMDTVRSGKCKIDDEQRLALLSLGLAIGYEKVRDVDENLQVLMNWFMRNCKNDSKSVAIAWRFNGPLYNMITKWKINPSNAEKRLLYIRSCYDWLDDYLGNYEKKHSNSGVLPIGYRANILGNKGAVEQELAKLCFSQSETGEKKPYEKIQKHLYQGLRYHYLAYSLRKTIVEQDDKNNTEVVKTGLARNIISMSTDLYYMALYNESLDISKRNELLIIALFGGDYLEEFKIPGYNAALDLQGDYDTDGFTWHRDDTIELRECEPCVIFRRMAGNCVLLYEHNGEDCNDLDVVSSLFRFIMLAAIDLEATCMADNDKMESRLEFFRLEIRDFVKDINDKFLGHINRHKDNLLFEDVLDKIEMVLKVYNALHRTNVKLDRRCCALKNY